MPTSSRSLVTGGRLLAVIIGIPLVIASAADGAFTLVGLYAHTSEHHQARYQLQGGGISLKTSAGSVQVVVGSGTAVEVSYTEHYEIKRPTVTSASTTGDGLQLVAKCPGGLLGNNCEINYVLTVPASAKLTVHTGDGSIRSSGTIGVQSFDSGDGSITLTDTGGTVVAHSGNGSVRGVRLQSASILASTGNGSIALAWTTAPTAVDATSGNGSIDVIVPAGSGPYQVSATTGNGSSHLAVPNDTSAKSSIEARSGNGSITIGYPTG